MPVYDSSGSLKVVGNFTIEVQESGSIISPNAAFVNFVGEGGTDVQVAQNAAGVTVTISSSVGGGPSSDFTLAIASGSTGQIVTASANFINFTGPGIESVNISGSGVTVTVITGSGGPGGSSTFSKGGVFLDPILPTDTVIWRADAAYTVTNVRAYLSGVSPCSASINTRVNSSANLTSNLFVTTSGNWWVGPGVINAAVASGDSLEIRLLSLSGSVKYVNIQVDLSS
jgi:hypothetical protein